MGRMGRGGGGGRSTDILLRRVELCRNKKLDLDGIVEYLRENYPDYRRTKEKPFIRMVQQTLDRINSSSSMSPSPGSGRKSVKRREDDVEERLMALEKAHVQRRRGDESSDDEEEEEEEGEVSTSEDAIYGEEVVPEFDLMKDMLRDSYSEKKTRKVKGEEKNMELEVGSGRKLELVNGSNNGGRDVEMRKERKEQVKNFAGDVGDVKGNEGPWFRDLGGMESVLEELKMEVLVPLYHPQLPPWLGVRPLAGILLYGPPGCGKTKLAHAIANETGVPFYKISATEVVSGVSGIYFFRFYCLLSFLYC